jgi:hypothetical protein
MSNTSTELSPLDQACRLVGRFFYYFARVEQKIDQAVIKLSDLDEKVAPVVASLDFGRKVELVRGSGWFNSWQETYHRSSPAVVLAATSGPTQWPPSD